MPFVSRDANTGRINGMFACRQYEGMEWLEDDHEDITFFKKVLKDPTLLLEFETFVTQKIAELDIKVRDFVYSKYPQHRQLSLTKLQTDAKLAEKTAAADYLNQCWAWMQTCFSYYYQLEDAIMNIATDVQKVEMQKRIEIQAVIDSIDFTVLETIDPKVTIRHAMELLVQ